MVIINGVETSNKVCEKLKLELQNLNKVSGKTPKFVIVLVGSKPASKIYVNSKVKKCLEVGINAELASFSENISEDELCEEVKKIAQSEMVNALMVQFPLPDHIDYKKVASYIPAAKDADGITVENLGKLCNNDEEGIVPATPMGIVMLMEEYNIGIAGKHCVIVGRSNIVGRPLSILLSNNSKYGNATVTLCHSKTKNLSKICKEADILIAAIGRAKFIKKEMVKENSIIIDVGINKVGNTGPNKIVGDVDMDDVGKVCYGITPVPGGVGPMTIAALMFNILKICKLQWK